MIPAAELELRRMTAADVDEVVEIERASFPKPWGPAEFHKELGHDWSTILLAVDARSGPEARAGKGAIAGFVLYWLVHDELHILNVACAPERRRQGVARRLLVEAEARAKAANIAVLVLEVRRSNTAAQALYTGLGYQRVGVRKEYYADDNEDAMVMTRTLKDRGF